jgi:hypothetical protein
MTILLRRVALPGIGLSLLLALASCVAGVGYGPDAGYDTDVNVGYSPGYIEPYGYTVGGWHDGYHIGPGRGGEFRSSEHSHSYRGAESSRPTPSIPHRSRRSRSPRAETNP